MFAGCLRNEVRRTCNDMQQEIKSGVDVVEKKKKSRKYTDRVENGIMNMRGKLSETRKLKESNGRNKKRETGVNLLWVRLRREHGGTNGEGRGGKATSDRRRGKGRQIERFYS